MSPPLISVLMPAYNHEPYVRLAVESVLGQTHANLELIAIDDNSADGTWEVLETISDHRLIRVRHQSNLGAHATLNEALRMATGEYIAIINSDDLYSDRRLETFLEAASKVATGSIWGFSDVEFIDDVGNKAPGHPRASSYLDLRASCAAMPWSAWFLAGNLALSTSNFFFSRQFLRKVGDFRPLRYTHDWDWALRASAHAAPIWVREKLLSYRIHESNTLSENDSWRHIHENSYVQSSALLTMARRPYETLGNDEDDAAPRTVCAALLGNESFHPVSLLCFLVSGLWGKADPDLLKLAGKADSGWLLEELATSLHLPSGLFHSIRRLAEDEKALVAQAAMLDERWQVMEQMGGEIANRDKWIADQAAALQDKDSCISAQTAMLEERWQVMEQMGGEIANRDKWIADQAAALQDKDSCISAQAVMLEERWQVMEQMGREIANRDKWIADQAAALQDKDSCISAQTAMIDERWNIIQNMNGEIARRDQDIRDRDDKIRDRDDKIRDRDDKIRDRDDKIANLEAVLTRINAHPAMRAARWVKRILGSTR